MPSPDAGAGTRAHPGSRKALFLDRDGVINVDTGYLHQIEQCVFVPGIFDLARSARASGYDVFVVTNQAGIARGYYGEADFEALTRWMLTRFEAERAPITQVYHCPHHPSEGMTPYRVACMCRKPAPGMLLRAAREHDIDLGSSIMVGDSPTDIMAAEAAGIRCRALLRDDAERVAAPDCFRASTHAQIEQAFFSR